jgi:hypothetical protein
MGKQLISFISLITQMLEICIQTSYDQSVQPHGRWFSPGSPAYSTTKTGSHDIAEILLKVALKF